MDHKEDQIPQNAVEKDRKVIPRTIMQKAFATKPSTNSLPCQIFDQEL